ncbi:MAG: regulatory protein RecX [Dermatophilaceae bacterium]
MADVHGKSPVSREIELAELRAALSSVRQGASAPPGVAPSPGSGWRRKPSPPPPDMAGAGRDADPDEVARLMVLRQLTMAPRSRSELARKLEQRGCAPEVAARVLDRMEQVGLVDDVAYAAMLVRSKRSTRGLARPALRAEMRRKGVSREVMEDALGQVSADDEHEAAARLVAKKLATMHGLDATVQARRLAGMLARKGYDGALARQVIREALREAPEHQRD